MCGIVGTIDFGGLDDAVGVRMVRALDRLRPRGPDGRGSWSDPRCAFGHTRLAIIDLSEGGAQPMIRDGLVITFNGEIYNHVALRRELESLGHTFRSRSDTEVLLAGWRQWGRDLLPRLHGMFAFGLWDARRDELVLVRDRYGKKPLLWRADGGRLTFSSDLLALRALSPGGEEIDPHAVKLLFSLRFIPEPWSIVRQIRKLPAGHMLRFTRGHGATVECWYDGPRAQGAAFEHMDDAAPALRSAFDAAVSERLEADVPVGTFLSGGIDSACVAASLVAQGRAVNSFTVGFPGAGAYYEERPAARRVAEHLGLCHTEVEISPGDARDALSAVFDACDEPFADSSALPVFLLSRATRQHVTVALSGDGADEVFGGYRKYLGEVHARRWGGVASLLLPVLNLFPERKDNRILELIRRARRFASHADKPAIERQAGWLRLLSEEELAELMLAGADGPTVEGLVAAARRHCTGDALSAMLEADIRLGLTGDMLVKVDRMSMANSLEVRCPFLDHRVVELAAAMPGHLKLDGRRGKLVVRAAFADRLPAEVFQLPKKGFEMPIAHWLTHELSEQLQRATDPHWLSSNGLAAAPVARWVGDLRSGRGDTSWRLWTLLSYRAWLDRWDAS